MGFFSEIIGWILKSVIADTIGWILSSIVLNILIKVPGYGIAVAICRLRSRKGDSHSQRLRQREIYPDEAMSITCGLLFWAIIAGIGYRFVYLKK
jgi:hypothetical protein